jgi:hypothetical protein
MGQLVLFQDLKVNAGANKFTLDLNSLQKGIYYVDLENNSNYQVTKIVKL